MQHDHQKRRQEIEQQIEKLKGEVAESVRNEQSIETKLGKIKMEKSELTNRQRQQHTDLQNVKSVLEREIIAAKRHETLLKNFASEIAYDRTKDQFKRSLNDCHIEQDSPFDEEEKPPSEESQKQKNQIEKQEHGPSEGVILAIAAEENGLELDEFSEDVSVAVNHRAISYETITLPGNITTEFLDRTNTKIQKSKLLFFLVSEKFVKSYWNNICQMKDINKVFYNNEPLLVPVALEKGLRFPMGMISTNHLPFHSRDRFYTKSLARLLEQFTL